ncbi:uncharacterized protein LOC123470316 isoform X3 [Daphnia magna]|uniref:uncharacterized protein LOC123470316 isoform X3 n=1 Tax=Daphnia magna TaxID=35525 RepID=UPI001E1BAE93|nr:uncharacterized protein LOC123470316 isoform X3 [Daphnia magna]
MFYLFISFFPLLLEMEGECFLNPCFGPRLPFQPIRVRSGKIARMASTNRYEDPKLNAQCLVILDRLQLTSPGKLRIPGPRKPRVFRVYSDCEVENTNDIRAKKKHRKRRMKGTKRLLQLCDSEDDFDSGNERLDYNFNNLNANSYPKNSAITSSEFVVEKSVSTPEGKRVLKSTISSTNNHMAKINSLTQFKVCQVEEITLSSDDEENEFSNKPGLAIPTVAPCTTESAETREKSLIVDTSLLQTSNGVEGAVPLLSALLTLVTQQDTPVAENENQSSRATGNADEKLKALLASNRFKPKGKLTKPTIPQAISGRQRASSAKSSKKMNKEPSMRKKLQEQQDLGSYCASVKTAHEKNSSTTTPITGEVAVRAIANKRQNYLSIQKPPVPLPPNVKAKTTSVSRGDKLTADLIVGENLRKIQNKDSFKTSFGSRTIPIRQSMSSNLLKGQPTASSEGELSKRDNELVTTDTNPTRSLSFKPCLKRVSRIPSNESTGGSESLQHLPTYSKNRSKDQEKHSTASIKANLALKEGIYKLKHSVVNLYGQGVKRKIEEQ